MKYGLYQNPEDTVPLIIFYDIQKAEDWRDEYGPHNGVIRGIGILDSEPDHSPTMHGGESQ